MPVTTTVSVTDTANPQDVIGCTVFSPPINQLAPDVTASQRTRHNQQRHARAAAGYVGQETIDTVGTITTGAWKGDPIDTRYLQVLLNVTCANTTIDVIPNDTYDNGDGGIGATCTFTTVGAVVFDGHTLALGDTVLFDSNVDPLHNGIYVVTTVPTASQAGVLTRHPAFNQGRQFPGALVVTQQGSTFTGSLWVSSNTIPPVLGVSGIGFTRTLGGVSIASVIATVFTGTGLTGGAHLNLGTTITISLVTPVAAINGGTAQTTWTLGDLLYASAANTLAKLAGNTTGTRNFLRQTGTGAVSAAPAWDTVTKTDVGLSAVENTALSTWPGTTNITTLGTIGTGTWAGTAIAINHGGTGQTTAGAAFDALSPMTTLGDVIYGGTSGTNTRLAGNTTATRNFLRQTGTGTVSAAPAWDTVTKTDVGLSAVENTALSTWAGSTNLTTLGTVTTGTWQAAVASTTVITFDTAVQTVRAEGTIDKTVASASFTSVAAAATIYSLTIKGGLLGTSGAVRVKIAGTFIANSGTPTFTFAITYGATTLWQDATGTFGASAINGAFEIHFTLNAANATNSQAVTGRITLGVKSTDPTTGHGRINSSPLYDGTLTGTSAEDSTADKTLAITFLPNVNNGSVGLTRLFACTEALP